MYMYVYVYATQVCFPLLSLSPSLVNKKPKAVPASYNVYAISFGKILKKKKVVVVESS